MRRNALGEKLLKHRRFSKEQVATAPNSLACLFGAQWLGLVGNYVQPEFLPALADPIIEAEERQSHDRCPGHERRGEMHRIERSNGRARKQLTGVLHDLRRDAQDLPLRSRRQC